MNEHEVPQEALVQPSAPAQSQVRPASSVECSGASGALSERPKRGQRIWGAAVAVWKYLCGMLFCQSLLGSVVVLGWTYRAAQRYTLRCWWKRSLLGKSGETFERFMASHESLLAQTRWPNWFVNPQGREEMAQARDQGFPRRATALSKALVRSLWLNFKTGCLGILNLWVLTLPAGALWLFSWYDGWNNSFNKGYEQAAVGPLTGILGVVWFIAVMFYVPMAQARQASTGQWRSFYQYRLVRGLIKRRWLACLGLAMLCSALTLPASILKTVPAYFPQISPAWSNITPAQALHALNNYFFWCALYVFAAFVVLRLVAARIYAGAVLEAVQGGSLDAEDLAPHEREALQKLGLLQPKAQAARPRLIRALTWFGTRLGRAVAGILVALVWFSLVAQIYTSEFLNYHPGTGWLNQPTMQLPWFRYVPSHHEKNQASP